MPGSRYILNESAYRLDHMAHIALREPITSIVQQQADLVHIARSELVTSIVRQGLSLGLCPTTPSPISQPSCQVQSAGRQRKVPGLGACSLSTQPRLKALHTCRVDGVSMINNSFEAKWTPAQAEPPSGE